MASNQDIGSRFPRQLSGRSQKFLIYETLFLFNERVDHVIELLCGMEKLPSADKESIQCAVLEINEVRCGINADFIERQADNERSDQGRLWKQRREFEKEWRDPDDVYMDVERREEERKRRGLPPRLGVLPHSAVAEGQKSREAGRERKKKRADRRAK